ncbi:MAG: hypothetical protein LAT52_06485 [Balneolales bacterium]|nr:hypothetical protein [Balneolales bacterium]
MNKPKLKKDVLLPSSRSNVRYSRSFIAKIMIALRRYKPIYLLAALSQMLFGLLVVGLSMVGLIQPIWVAAIVNVLGCISVLAGSYQLYDMLRKNSGALGLVSEAMNDAINYRN